MAGTLMSPDRLHVSLFSVGGFSSEIPASVIAAAESAADAISVDAFTVVFDRVTRFGGGDARRAIVLTGGEGVAGLFRLHQVLSRAMAAAGVGSRRQKASFTPHMTVMYSNEPCDMPIEPMPWSAQEFVLIDSWVGQSRHDILRRWPLRANCRQCGFR